MLPVVVWGVTEFVGRGGGKGRAADSLSPLTGSSCSQVLNKGRVPIVHEARAQAPISESTQTSWSTLELEQPIKCSIAPNWLPRWEKPPRSTGDVAWAPQALMTPKPPEAYGSRGFTSPVAGLPKAQNHKPSTLPIGPLSSSFLWLTI